MSTGYCRRRRAGASSLIFAPEALETRRLLSAVTWTNADGTGVWSDPLNWSDYATPSHKDDVAIDGAVPGTITLDTNVDVSSLTNYGRIDALLLFALPM